MRSLAGKKVLLLVNPFGGTGNGRYLCDRIVLPSLVSALIQVTVIETQFRSHAQRVGAETNWDDYSALISVGGDGLLHEVISGIFNRPDSESSSTAAFEKGLSILSRLSIGIIPAGTGNGLAASLNLVSVEKAVDAIVRGNTKAVDLFRLNYLDAAHRDGTGDYYSKAERVGAVGFLSLTWGTPADFDYLTEDTLRWMGYARIFVAPVYCMMRGLTYRGKLTLKGPTYPASSDAFPTFAAPGSPEAAATLTRYLEQTCSLDNKVYSTVHTTPLQAENSAHQTQSSSSITAEYRKDTNEIVLSGEFTMLIASNTPKIAFAAYGPPYSQMDDAAIDVLVLGSCSRLRLLKVMALFDSGGHVAEPGFRYYRCKSFLFEPEGGYISVDGEVIRARDLGVTMVPQAMNVFC